MNLLGEAWEVDEDTTWSSRYREGRLYREQQGGGRKALQGTTGRGRKALQGTAERGRKALQGAAGKGKEGSTGSSKENEGRIYSEQQGTKKRFQRGQHGQ